MRDRTEALVGQLILLACAGLSFQIAEWSPSGADRWELMFALGTIASCLLAKRIWFAPRSASLTLEATRACFVPMPPCLVLYGWLSHLTGTEGTDSLWPLALLVPVWGLSLCWRLSRSPDLGDSNPLPGLLRAGLRPDGGALVIQSKLRLAVGVAASGAAAVLWSSARDSAHVDTAGVSLLKISAALGLVLLGIYMLWNAFFLVDPLEDVLAEDPREGDPQGEQPPSGPAP